MRNLLVFSLVALCAVLVSSESAMAGGGGGGNGGGGKGGGKAQAHATITFHNQDAFDDVRIYVQAPGEVFPGTVGELLPKTIVANALSPVETDKLKAGNYQVYAIAAGYFTGQAPEAIIPAGAIPMATKISLAGVNKEADVILNDQGIGQISVRN